MASAPDNGNGSKDRLDVGWGDKQFAVSGISVITIIAMGIVGGLVLWTASEAKHELRGIVSQVLENQTIQMDRVITVIKEITTMNHADHLEIQRKMDAQLCVSTMTPLQRQFFAAQYTPGREYMVCPWLIRPSDPR